MLVHGIGVQFGIAIGLVEMIASTRSERAAAPAVPQEDLRVLTNAYRN